MQNPAVGSLSLYDMVGTPGVAADLSHINTSAKVEVRQSGQWALLRPGLRGLRRRAAVARGSATAAAAAGSSGRGCGWGAGRAAGARGERTGATAAAESRRTRRLGARGRATHVRSALFCGRCLGHTRPCLPRAAAARWLRALPRNPTTG